jgi:hypothetical protein
MNAQARVRLLVHAANRVAHDPEAIDALTAHGPLSRGGVELALREHLELTPSDAEIAQLLAAAPSHTEHTTVILAANVFVGALRALAVAAASSAHVHVRPSRRDPLFATALVQAARTLGAEWISLHTARDLKDVRGAVHVYGRADTVAAVRAGVGPEIAVYAHGPGFSVAWVDTDDAAPLLARDIVPFDQRGCLSPRVTYVLGEERARSFAASLSRELGSSPVPRGALDEAEKAEWTRYVDTWAMAALDLHEGSEHVVVVTDAAAPFALAPVGRAMHVVVLEAAEQLAIPLTPFESQLVAIAGAPESLRLARVRRCALGHLQRPPFDGPVDLRALTATRT